MKLSFSTRLNSLLLSVQSVTLAGKTGDEVYGDEDGGKFWAFHSSGVSIVDPLHCKVLETITVDANGDPLPQSWESGAYMEKHTNDALGTHGFVLINSGVTSYNRGEDDFGVGEVVVFQTTAKHIEATRVEVGGSPSDSYFVRSHDEFWSHSETKGSYYAISLDDLLSESRMAVEVGALEDGEYPGKLIWDEGSHLQSVGSEGIAVGYLTSTGTQTITIVDLDKKEQVTAYSFGFDVMPDTCLGTRSVAYSDLTKHLFAECTNDDGIIEIDVSDQLAPQFVKQHDEVTGTLTQAPNEGLIIATDQYTNQVNFLRPTFSGSESLLVYQLEVPGHPEIPSYYPLDHDHFEHTHHHSEDPNHEKYSICMPLTENTDRNNMNLQGDVVCDYFDGCTGATTETDVRNGICAHEGNTTSLLTADLSEIELVRNKSAPFFGSCTRCERESNYVNYNKVCICSPHCGSCADHEFDARNTGVACINLEQILASDGGAGAVAQMKKIVGAGGVEQPMAGSEGLQCGFKRPERSHKRGGNYDASVAHYPHNALEIVNMKDMSLKCAVSLPGSPDSVVYVPNRATEVPTEDIDPGMGPATGVILCAILVACLVASCWEAFANNSNSKERTADGQTDRRARTWIRISRNPSH